MPELKLRPPLPQHRLQVRRGPSQIRASRAATVKAAASRRTPKAWRILARAHPTSYNKVFAQRRMEWPVRAALCCRVTAEPFSSEAEDHSLNRLYARAEAPAS